MCVCAVTNVPYLLQILLCIATVTTAILQGIKIYFNLRVINYLQGVNRFNLVLDNTFEVELTKNAELEALEESNVDSSDDDGQGKMPSVMYHLVIVGGKSNL